MSKRFDTIAGRTMALLLVGLGLFHLLSVWAYQAALEAELASNHEARVADHLLAIRRSLATQPAQAREPLAHEMSGGAVDAHYGQKALAVARAGDTAAQSLRARLIALEPDLVGAGLIIGSEAGNAEGHGAHQIVASLGLGDGTFANVSIVKLKHVSSGNHATIWSTSLMALGVILASLVIVRWITKPLRLLGAAAQTIGQASRPNAPALVPVPENGPREVVETARAFNEMQRRIVGLIEDRTLSLAAISHDLKTPLTRLRLQIEDVTAADQKARMIADIGEMEQMIDGTLAFIRGVPDDQPSKLYDVGAIVETICSDLADQGHDVRLVAERNTIALGHPLQIKRALTNLIQNAVRHGGNARVRVAREADGIMVVISDNGPGIPIDKLDDMRRPFTRLDDARSDRPGSGLGLAVAERLIMAQGGTMVAANVAPTGLEVRVQLAGG